MWVVRELGRLVVRIAVIVAVALVLALVLAALGAGSFHGNARVFGLVFGCGLLAMGAVGRGSNIERFSDQGVMRAAWGKIPGFDALKSHPEEPQLAPGPALVVSGLVLIVLGVTVL